MREALIEREVLLADRAAHHLAAALRAAASRGLAAGVAAAARPVPLRSSRRPKAAAADALGRSRARRGRQAADARPLSQRASNIRIAGSTTPASSCSPRAMRPIAARISAPGRARSETRQADGLWQVTRRGHAERRAQHHRGARAGQCRRPVGRRGADAAAPASTPSAKVRLVKGRHIVVPQLYEHDRAYIFQNSDGRIVFAIPVSGRLHADRHHRPRLRRRSRQGEGHGGGDRLSLRVGQRISGASR